MYFNSDPALMPQRKRPFQLAKCRKIRDFNVDFLKEISGAPLYWGGATVPLLRPHPEGAPRLSSA